MDWTRRAFVSAGAASLAAAAAHAQPRVRQAPSTRAPVLPLLRPERLRRGDVVAVVNPSSAPGLPEDATSVARVLESLGLRIRPGSHLGRKRATDEERAQDLNDAFADRTVRAILPVRGGWGCARLLPLLDYDLIQAHPKVLMGFSDAAALLLGIHARTGLVTFHGPLGVSRFDRTTVDQVRRVLFRDEASRVAAPPRRSRTLVRGRARGPLLGGNLTVVASLIGSPYLAKPEGAIVFLEEVREPSSEIDRMLTQLEQSSLLDDVKGVVLGQFEDCQPPQADTALTAERVLRDFALRVGAPAWGGASIGHTPPQLVLPLGVPAEVDADARTLTLLEPAVA